MRQIYLREHGIFTGTDCSNELTELFKQYPENAEFIFEEGDYHFSPKILRDLRLSNSDAVPLRKIGIILENMKNVRLVGNNTRLLFEGQMQAVTMLFCENVVMSGFTIDWEKPLVSEGIVTAFDEKSVDLFIDPKAFPHKVEDNTIVFDIGGGEWSVMHRGGQMQFDAETRCVRRTTGDRFSLGKMLGALGENVYRFEVDHPNTSVGNIIALRHNSRMHAGIFAEKCKNITIEDVNIHSCGGLGCLAQFCDTLTCRRVNFIPNTEAGRKVTNGRDDGMHITCCCGTVTITECSFVGLMDDPINVHGCCVTGVEWLDDRTLRCRYMHPQSCGFKYWAENGDDIVFIERKSMAPVFHAEAEEYILESSDAFLLKFKNPVDDVLPGSNPNGFALDNLTHTASFICTNNRFGSCRARGVLVSTPKPVLIADNLFQSSGSAILVAGDSNYWFESGECHDVEIRNNVFTDACLSSMYQFCEGIISVCPVVPEPSVKTPFHKNIRIHDNIFDTPDTPVLYAYSCGGLTFKNNTVFRSTGSEKWHPGKSLIKLAYCSGIECSGNRMIGRFSLNFMETDNCENISAD